MCSSIGIHRGGGGSTARLGGRELTLLCGFNQYKLSQNRDNSGLLGTRLYCSPKLGGGGGGGATAPLPPPPPPDSVRVFSRVSECRRGLWNRLITHHQMHAACRKTCSNKGKPLTAGRNLSHACISPPMRGYLYYVGGILLIQHHWKVDIVL